MKYTLLLLFLLSCLTMLAQESESLRLVNFEILNDTAPDFNSPQAYKEFELKGIKPLKCAIKLLTDETALLFAYPNGIKQIIDTLYYVPYLNSPSFEITDFNQDGNEDFMSLFIVNMHGNSCYSVYLNSPSENNLVTLKNTAEDENWINPEYDKKTNILTCTKFGGVFGVSGESRYRLEDLKATPLSKKETDYTNYDQQTRKGGLYREFVGENGKWKLIKLKRSVPR